MAYCTNCGGENSEDAKFCGNCGHKVEVPAEEKRQVKEISVEKKTFLSIDLATRIGLIKLFGGLRIIFLLISVGIFLVPESSIESINNSSSWISINPVEIFDDALLVAFIAQIAHMILLWKLKELRIIKYFLFTAYLWVAVQINFAFPFEDLSNLLMFGDLTFTDLSHLLFVGILAAEIYSWFLILRRDRELEEN